MRIRLICGAIFALAVSGRAQTADEWKLDLKSSGLTKPSCVWYPGRAEFLDDNHLAVSAPVAYSCNKDDRGKPTDTRITVMDLQGHKSASIQRPDVVNSISGPLGYVAVCTGQRIELLSPDLQVASSLALSNRAKAIGCYFGSALSPSRTAIEVRGPADSEARLYEGAASDPIADFTPPNGHVVSAVTDRGFLVCKDESEQCDVVDPHGVVSKFTMPQLGGAAGNYIVGMVAPDRLLLGSFDGRRLFVRTPTGEEISMGDVGTVRPPFIDSSDAQMSAVEPRRILYRVDGCPLGDFDDCYGILFRRFAVFDSRTGRLLFRHTYASGANLSISPNGHLVMEQDGPRVRFFRVP